MKSRKLHTGIANVLHYVVTIAAGSGIGAWLCKILNEDAWSWKGWTFKHKVIYWIVSTALCAPVVLYMISAKEALMEKIEDDDEFDD